MTYLGCFLQGDNDCRCDIWQLRLPLPGMRASAPGNYICLPHLAFSNLICFYLSYFTLAVFSKATCGQDAARDGPVVDVTFGGDCLCLVCEPELPVIRFVNPIQVFYIVSLWLKLP
jgi:hypothetical protein